MAIKKRALLHFVNFFASKFDVSRQHLLLPPTSFFHRKTIQKETMVLTFS